MPNVRQVTTWFINWPQPSLHTETLSTKPTSVMKRFQPRVITSFATHVASRPAQTSSDVPVRLKVCLRSTMATPVELLVPQCGRDRMFVHVMLKSCCHLRALSAFSVPAAIQSSASSSPSDSCKRTCRQSINQEHKMHSFTFLCARLPPVRSQSACPAATPVFPRGREYTEVQLPPAPFVEYLSPISLLHHTLCSMTHNPTYEHWLHCWLLRTHHTTHILSHQSVEPV